LRVISAAPPGARRPGSRAADSLVRGALLLCLAGFASAAAAVADHAPQESLLEVRVNGQAMPPTLVLTRADGSVWVRRSQLAGWRIATRTPNRADLDAEAFVSLDALEGTVYAIDRASQLLLIDTAPTALEATVIGHALLPAAEPGAAPLGAIFNYDLTLQSADRRTLGGGLFEAVVFGRLGSVATTAMARTAPERSLLRLETTWTIDRPDQKASWRLGDSISHAGSWSEPLRFAGIQYATNFAMQPGFNSLAAPALAGVAALPSTVDLYINDALRMRSEVPAGPFDIAQWPVITGAGQARLVVRDVLGREQILTTPFYASSQLLRPGLRDFSFELGAARARYGNASNDYGPLLAVATERRGFNQVLTGELHAEVSRARQAVGLGAVWLWPSAGVFSAAVAGSRSTEGNASSERKGYGLGGLLSVGFQRQAERISFGAEWVSRSDGFSSLGRSTSPANDASPAGLSLAEPRQQARAYASYASRQHGSLGLDYAQRTFADRPTDALLSGSYGIGLGKGYLSVALLRDLRARQTFASLTYSQPLGRDVNGSVGLTSQVGGPPVSRWQAQRSLPMGDGYGYRVAATSGHSPRVEGGLQLQNSQGGIALDLSQSARGTAWRVGAAGGLALLGGDVFASRTLSDSFSVVDAGGFAGVRIYADNQLVGRTGADGTAIVPRLLAYQATPVRLEQADLPLNASVGALDLVAQPSYRSGVSLRFVVRQWRGALLTALLEDGSPVPAGAVARLAGVDLDQPVANDGALYLTGLATTNQVVLRWGTRQCLMAIDFAETADPLPQLGSFLCRESRG